MGIINQLDIQTANLIAAGEVVDRPASACKELLENSIDAGATVVTVEIKNGGSTLIRVSDNGKGMERDDLPLAIKRHATSKIKNARDLDAIMTLGFRGEALAAIASVSHLRILTKRHEDMSGTQLECLPGKTPELSEIAISDGTTVIVENLFENVPARRKFLKKDQTEAMAVTANVEKIALSNPGISIRLISDGQTRFCTAGDGKLKNTIYSLLGRDFASRMIALDLTTNGVRVYGFVGTPDNIRANRNYQNFFVNKRYVKSKCAQAALEQAFTSYAPAERFPTCVLFIEIPPQTVDVNVHPAKLEVKFSNEKAIFEAIYYAVRGVLESKITRPELIIPNTGTSDQNILRQKAQNSALNAFVPLNDRSEPVEKRPYLNQKNVKQGQLSIDDVAQKLPIEPEHTKNLQQIDESATISSDSYLGSRVNLPPEIESIKSVASTDMRSDKLNAQLPPEIMEIKPGDQFADEEPAQNPPQVEQQPIQKKLDANVRPTDIPLSEPPNPKPPVDQPEPAAKPAQESQLIFRREPLKYRLIGEAFYSYVFLEYEDKVLVIDKHAAHERIIFEELRQNLATHIVATQLMLVPLKINLTPEELQSVSDHRDEIRGIGFEFEIEEPHTLSVLGIPQQIEPEAASGMLETLAGQLASGTTSTEIQSQLLFENALYQASCKAAIKAGHLEDDEHIKWICDRLLSLNDIKFCPHGRPVAFEISKANLEHQFKRT